MAEARPRQTKCIPGVSAAGWLGVGRRSGAIVLEVFGRVGLNIGELRNFELVGVGENHRWPGNVVDLSFRELTHFLQLADVPREVRRVGWARG